LKSLNLSLARIAVKIVTGTAMQLFDHGHKYGKNLKASYGADLGVNSQIIIRNSLVQIKPTFVPLESTADPGHHFEVTVSVT
jgi:hypothetical protein